NLIANLFEIDGFTLSASTTEQGSSTLSFSSPEGHNAFTISGSGNIGIGTSTPEYSLDTPGSIRATAFINSSERGKKTDISPFDETDNDNLMEAINELELNNYRYKTDNATTTRIGFMVEDVPDLFASEHGDGIDLYKLSTAAIGGVKNLDTRVSDIEELIGTSTNALLDEESLYTTMRDFLWQAGVKVKDGVLAATDIVTNRLTVGSSSRPSGITLYDRETGEPYCLEIVGGEPESTPGECEDVPASTQDAPADTTDSSDDDDDDSGSGTTTPTDTGTTTPPTDDETSTSTDDGVDSDSGVDDSSASSSDETAGDGTDDTSVDDGADTASTDEGSSPDTSDDSSSDDTNDASDTTDDTSGNTDETSNDDSGDDTSSADLTTESADDE
ncbi:MAG: tail fiber domain-containing protein, partial [Candidatus Paceibacterota bacterium]